MPMLSLRMTTAFQRRQKARFALPLVPQSEITSCEVPNMENENCPPVPPSAEIQVVTAEAFEPDAPAREPSRRKEVTTRCQFSFADGRRCAMLRWPKHALYCLPHAREEQQLLALDQLGRELASLSGEFKTANDVNHVLGKVLALFARNRLARRDAVAFAYMGQLLLQSLPGVKREIKEALGQSAWQATVTEALCAPEQDTEEEGSDEPSVKTSVEINAETIQSLDRNPS